MGQLGERLRHMTVEARSPDRTVTLRYTADGTVHVALARGCLHRHTAASLAGQVRAVIRVAVAAQGRGGRLAWRETAESFGDDPESAARTGALVSSDSPFGRYLQANNSIATAGGSDSRRVRVTRAGDGEVSVEIRPGSLRHATEQAFAAEIRQAILAALADHRRQDRELLRRFVGADIAQLIFGSGS